jgi:hypothetical protein
MALTANAAEEVSVSSVADFVFDSGIVNKLTADLNESSYLLLEDGNNLVLDLNGHKWTSSDSVLRVAGGSCIAYVYDSSAAKTGAIISTANDAIALSNGELKIENITVKGGDGNMDAVIVEGGKLTAINCTMSAGKAGINADNASESVVADAFADILVIGGKFATYSAPSDRNCAIELRRGGANGPKIVLTGAIAFDNNKIMVQKDTFAKTADAAIVAGADATVSFGAEENVAGRNNYKVATIAYTYSGTGDVPTPPAPSNPETGDSFVVVTVAVAMIALAGVVVSKKVRA